MGVMVAKKVKRTMQKENSILIKKKKNRMFRMRMLNKEKKVMEMMVMTTWRMNQRVKSSNLKRTMVMIRRMIINRREKLRLKIIKSTIMVINMNITMQ